MKSAAKPIMLLSTLCYIEYLPCIADFFCSRKDYIYMRKIIPNILAVIAVLNLVWLFVFDYKVPSFVSPKTGLAEDESVSDEEIGQLIAETEEKAPGETGQTAEQETDAVEPVGEDGPVTDEAAASERTCRPKEGNAPNIRSGPGSDYDVIGTADFEETLIVTGEEEDGWLPVRTSDGTEGYVFADMVELQD